ncbi:hypothetical protein LTR65_010923 [Meristemomyces frigidus]
MAAPACSSLEDIERLMAGADIDTLRQVTQRAGEVLAKRLQERNQTSSPLLRLPQELRDQILCDVLDEEVSEGGITRIRLPEQHVELTRRGWCDEYGRTQYLEPLQDDYEIEAIAGSSPPALLHACRQLRQDAANLFYATSYFHGTEDAVGDWLSSLSPKHSAIVAMVEVAYLCRRSRSPGDFDEQYGLTEGSTLFETDMKYCRWRGAIT